MRQLIGELLHDIRLIWAIIFMVEIITYERRERSNYNYLNFGNLVLRITTILFIKITV